MSQVCDFYEFIDSFAPFDTAMDFDNVGLLIGDKNQIVKNVLVALDITKEVIDEAKRLDAQLIITHHPIIFNPMKRIPADDLRYQLILSQISVISAHTNLDLAQLFGVNTALADALQLQNQGIIEPSLPIVTGTLPYEMSADEFQKYVSQKLSNPRVRSNYKKIKKNICTVAVGGGACGEFVGLMAQSGIDAFVTGEIKHHEFLMAIDDGLLAVDAGHYYTENVVIKPLADKLAQRFCDVNVHISTVENDY